jgi:uncharacterized membrane protein
MERERHPYDTLIDAFYRMKIPGDLLVCELWLAGALLTIFIPILNASPLRVIFCVPFLLFVPGYVLIAVLFPAARDIGGIQRLALSVGLSVTMVPLTGYALNFSQSGIRLVPIVICLSILSAGLCLAAQYRRAQVPINDRFTVPIHEIRDVVSNEFMLPADRPRSERILSVILLIAIIVAVLTTVVIIVVPKDGERFSEFFILGEDQKAANFPTSFSSTTNNSLFIGIANHEYRTVNYTVETYFMNMTIDNSTQSPTLNAMVPVDRLTIRVADNQTIVNPYSFTTGTTEYNRVEFLLFNESVPDDQITGLERINQSYRELHLWVTVTP